MKKEKYFSFLQRTVQRLFTYDLRSLALMRIVVAFVLLLDICFRLSNLQAHYSNDGVMPLDAVFRYSWDEHFFSLYAITGSKYLQLIVFLINAICVLLLMVGYRTRLFTILCWLFLVSLHNRNQYVQQGGDDLLRLLLFWCMFIPWHARYSLDKQWNRIKNYESNKIVSLAAFAYMLQVGYVYFFSANLKSSAEWTSEYSAVYYALSLDQMVLPLGKVILHYESFLKVLTCIVYYLELLTPIVLIIPFFTRQFRILFVVLILFLQIGIALTLNVGLFPIIATAAMIGLLPGNTCEKLFDYLRNIVPNNLFSKIKFDFNSFIGTPMVEAKYNEPYFLRLIILYFMVYVFNWNMMTIRKGNLVSNSYLKWVGPMLRIDQNWGMFSPGVFKDDGWFIFEATDKKNKKIDLLQEGRTVSYQKLSELSMPFKEDRWRKYSENILYVSNAHLRPFYCSYLINKWNSTHLDTTIHIKSLQIVYMKEITLPGYKVIGPTREMLCECEAREGK